MFILYKSIKFQVLIKKAYNIILKNPLSNPLNKEIFIVPNKEIEQWIKIFIAKKYNVSANIKFLQLNDFMWKIFKKSIPNYNFKSQFNKYSIIWKIMKLPNIKKLIFKITLEKKRSN